MARTDFKPFMQFRATNAANLLFAFELARRLEGTGVTATPTTRARCSRT
jgi:hypothetical protein